MTELPIVDPYPDVRDVNPGRDVFDAYMTIVRDAILNTPRNLQVRIGPSEMGTPCARRIGYKLANHPENPREAPWKATVGTAIHAWLEEHFTQANADVYPLRYIVEGEVEVGQILGNPITGHCDLFDRMTGTVIDHKTVGPTQLKKYKSKGPGQKYRIQTHLYGRGWVARGQDVRHVAIMFLPRNGELRDAYFWHEPYDEQVALDALQRVEGIALTVGHLGPNAPAALPTADDCTFCPYFMPGSTDLTVGCPGDQTANAAREAARKLEPPALTLTRTSSTTNERNQE